MRRYTDGGSIEGVPGVPARERVTKRRNIPAVLFPTDNTPDDGGEQGGPSREEAGDHAAVQESPSVPPDRNDHGGDRAKGVVASISGAGNVLTDARPAFATITLCTMHATYCTRGSTARCQLGLGLEQQ